VICSGSRLEGWTSTQFTECAAWKAEGGVMVAGLRIASVSLHTPMDDDNSARLGFRSNRHFLFGWSSPIAVGSRYVGAHQGSGTPTIGGGMDRGASGDSLNASCRDQSAPGESCDRVDRGFSIRGRTHRHRQTARMRFRDKSHHQAVHRGRAEPRLAGLGGPSATLRDRDQDCGRPNRAKGGSRRSLGLRRTGRAAK